MVISTYECGGGRRTELDLIPAEKRFGDITNTLTEIAASICRQTDIQTGRCWVMILVLRMDDEQG